MSKKEEAIAKAEAKADRGEEKKELAKEEAKEDVAAVKNAYPKKVKFKKLFEGSFENATQKYEFKVYKPEMRAAIANNTLPEREVANEGVYNWLKKFGVLDA